MNLENPFLVTSRKENFAESSFRASSLDSSESYPNPALLATSSPSGFSSYLEDTVEGNNSSRGNFAGYRIEQVEIGPIIKKPLTQFGHQESTNENLTVVAGTGNSIRSQTLSSSCLALQVAEKRGEGPLGNRLNNSEDLQQIPEVKNPITTGFSKSPVITIPPQEDPCFKNRSSEDSLETRDSSGKTTQEITPKRGSLRSNSSPLPSPYPPSALSQKKSGSSKTPSQKQKKVSFRIPISNSNKKNSFFSNFFLFLENIFTSFTSEENFDEKPNEDFLEEIILPSPKKGKSDSFFLLTTKEDERERKFFQEELIQLKQQLARSGNVTSGDLGSPTTCLFPRKGFKETSLFQSEVHEGKEIAYYSAQAKLDRAYEALHNAALKELLTTGEQFFSPTDHHIKLEKKFKDLKSFYEPVAMIPELIATLSEEHPAIPSQKERSLFNSLQKLVTLIPEARTELLKKVLEDPDSKTPEKYHQLFLSFTKQLFHTAQSLYDLIEKNSSLSSEKKAISGWSSWRDILPFSPSTTLKEGTIDDSSLLRRSTQQFIWRSISAQLQEGRARAKAVSAYYEWDPEAALLYQKAARAYHTLAEAWLTVIEKVRLGSENKVSFDQEPFRKIYLIRQALNAYQDGLLVLQNKERDFGQEESSLHKVKGIFLFYWATQQIPPERFEEYCHEIEEVNTPLENSLAHYQKIQQQISEQEASFPPLLKKTAHCFRERALFTHEREALLLLRKIENLSPSELPSYMRLTLLKDSYNSAGSYYEMASFSTPQKNRGELLSLTHSFVVSSFSEGKKLTPETEATYYIHRATAYQLFADLLQLTDQPREILGLIPDKRVVPNFSKTLLLTYPKESSNSIYINFEPYMKGEESFLQPEKIDMILTATESAITQRNLEAEGLLPPGTAETKQEEALRLATQFFQKIQAVKEVQKTSQKDFYIMQ